MKLHCCIPIVATLGAAAPLAQTPAAVTPPADHRVDAQAQSGFDIYSELRDGVTMGVHAFASPTGSDGSNAFYRVALSTGGASLGGSFNKRDEVIDIAIPLDQL